MRTMVLFLVASVAAEASILGGGVVGTSDGAMFMQISIVDPDANLSIISLEGEMCGGLLSCFYPGGAFTIGDQTGSLARVDLDSDVPTAYIYNDIGIVAQMVLPVDIVPLSKSCIDNNPFFDCMTIFKFRPEELGELDSPADDLFVGDLREFHLHPTPEPGTWISLGLGVLLCTLARFRAKIPTGKHW